MATLNGILIVSEERHGKSYPKIVLKNNKKIGVSTLEKLHKRHELFGMHNIVAEMEREQRRVICYLAVGHAK